jgi:hypothetical protein
LLSSFRQLGDVGGDAPRLVAGEEVRRRAPSQMSQMMSGAAAPQERERV